MLYVKRFVESSIPILWCCFAFWQLLFGMNISGFICLMVLPWFLGPLNPKKRHWTSYLFVYIGVGLMLWTIGIGEYSKQLRYYSCKSKQAYGVPDNRYPRWCSEFDLVKPQHRSNKRIFSYRERVAIRIHHVTHLLFLQALGFSENSRKGWGMYFVQSPIEGIEYYNLGERRRLCTNKGHLGGDTRISQNDFAMASPYMRHQIATHLPELEQIAAWENRGKTLSFYKGNHPIFNLLAQESLHVGTTLKNETTLFAKQTRDQRSVKLSLQSSVFYNIETIGIIKIPNPFGYHSIPIDNSMYCGLTMDGWLRPYYQEWWWQIPIQDPRIYDRGVDSRSIDSGEEFAIWFLKRYLANNN